jgi:SnoaL-like domain
MAHCATHVIVFDVKPPFQTKGADAYRRTWEACLPYFPASFQIEMRDLSITVSGDLALAHWLFRLTGMEKDHPAMQTWMRSLLHRTHLFRREILQQRLGEGGLGLFIRLVLLGMRAAEPDETRADGRLSLIAFLRVTLVVQPFGALTAPLVREPAPHRLVLQALQGGPRKGEFLMKDLGDLRQIGLKALPVRRFQGGDQEHLLQLWIDRHPKDDVLDLRDVVLRDHHAGCVHLLRDPRLELVTDGGKRLRKAGNHVPSPPSAPVSCQPFSDGP